MKIKQPNKSHTLLAKIGNSDVTTESQLLKDRGLLELFSWGSDRAPRARIKDTLALLVKQGDITLGSIESERIYRLTVAGKQKLQLSHYRIAAAKRPATWNQRWHFVTYQIPESKKIARNQFIIELKRIGFRRYAPALWIYPYDTSRAVHQIANYYKVAQYIDFLRADTISKPSTWRRHFGL
ncbi:hypothetical protein IT415_00515 [bacterium]|nr:hypothetical protein [bacterium]